MRNSDGQANQISAFEREDADRYQVLETDYTGKSARSTKGCSFKDGCARAEKVDRNYPDNHFYERRRVGSQGYLQVGAFKNYLFQSYVEPVF